MVRVVHRTTDLAKRIVSEIWAEEAQGKHFPLAPISDRTPGSGALDMPFAAYPDRRQRAVEQQRGFDLQAAEDVRRQ